mmetsp:Transcript_778/g.1593  ORF Transcript_778/g.1593 Transcript_778/m.1593 type:complete len:91 (+) Transcript_778:116-388(+)
MEEKRASGLDISPDLPNQIMRIHDEPILCLWCLMLISQRIECHLVETFSVHAPVHTALYALVDAGSEIRYPFSPLAFVFVGFEITVSFSQ